ncbi:MAG: preprotein translocase subunit SecE [Planctomycetia bacterium]|nr:preprotein translocase subunit SecE [Planctomycetia bacterium]
MIQFLVSFLSEMFRVNLYKRTQGKIVRQATAFAVFAVLFGAVWQFSTYLHTSSVTISLRYLLPALMAFIFAWFCFRLVQFPRFADFLIKVEAEMRKVSWPSKQELITSSSVVIFVMFFLAAILFGYDLLLKWLVDVIGIGAAKVFAWLGIF